MRSTFPLLALALLLAAGCDEAVQYDVASNRSAPGVYDDSELPPLAPDDDDDAATSDDDDTEADPTDPDYALDVTSIHPAPESVDHHYRQPIVIGFNGYAAGVNLRVVNELGESLGTDETWNDDFTAVTLYPYELYTEAQSAFLRPSHTYVVSVAIGDAGLSWSFTTSEIGTAVADAEALQGRTYAMSFADARSSATPTLVSLLSAVSGPTWLWQVDLSEGNVDFNSGVGSEDDDADGFHQDLCVPTGLVGGVGADVTLQSNPYFASEPGDFTLWLDGEQLGFEEGWIDGDFIDDGSALAEMSFRGWLREDSLTPLLGENACALMESQADLSCEVCPSGDGQCAWVLVQGVSGTETALELEDVDADADGDPNCSDDAATDSLLSCSAAGGRSAGWLLLPLLFAARRRS